MLFYYGTTKVFDSTILKEKRVTLYKTPEKVKIRLQTMKSFLLSLNTFFYG
ncbi:MULTISPECIES: hypothetical protein [unclassified Catenibacterium]|uniref:hypothetical protein n=1 Tax=unclassified Catenibacterium TaxID=2643636 RepID=UPI001314F20E|nr:MULTISPECIES: hypothetical protein [unclassified Catenibacterium]